MLQATIRLFHRPLVNLLERFWREKPADLLISVIPHFNRQICESWTKVYPARPFVTIITDLADFRPDSGSSRSKINMSSRVLCECLGSRGRKASGAPDDLVGAWRPVPMDSNMSGWKRANV